MIKADGLTKRYDDDMLAVDHLTLNVKPGQIYCLLGANGAGKTTAINLFLNLIAPTSGRAFINDVDCVNSPIEAKKYVSFIPENVMLYGNLTAQQNLHFFSSISGKEGIGAHDIIQVMRRVGLPERSFRQRAKSMSKGMRQKLAVATAILKDAPALLLDEPTSGLDPKAGSEFLLLLKELREKGKAILISTHDVFRAKEVSDVVGIMKDGLLIVEMQRDDFKNEDMERLYLEYIEPGGHSVIR